MKKYYIAYHCLLCSTVFAYGDATELPYDELPDLCGKVVLHQLDGNKYGLKFPKYTHHKCPDGSCGLAHFAGFSEVKK